VDQRGVKAFADRAIFILTSNAGQESISTMTAERKPLDEIIERVKEDLRNVRHSHSNEPVFSPEFLARIGEIVIFKPLDQEAMEGICRRMLDHMQKTWQEKREKTLDIDSRLIEHIAAMGHKLNEEAKGKEGGRIIRKLISQLVEASIQREASHHEAAYKTCATIKLSLGVQLGEALPFGPAVPPKVLVQFLKAEPNPSLVGFIEQAVVALRDGLEQFGDAGATVPQALPILSRLESELLRNGYGVSMSDDKLLADCRSARLELEALAESSDQRARVVVSRLVDSLKGAVAEVGA